MDEGLTAPTLLREQFDLSQHSLLRLLIISADDKADNFVVIGALRVKTK